MTCSNQNANGGPRFKKQKQTVGLLVIRSSSGARNKNPSFVEFSDLHGVNTPTTTNLIRAIRKNFFKGYKKCV